jgi:hypothetical protein
MSEPQILADKLPEQARKAVVSNVTGGSGPWVLVNLTGPSPVVIPSGKLTREQWLSVFDALRSAGSQQL